MHITFSSLCWLFNVGFLHRLFNERLLDPTTRTHLGVFSGKQPGEWILNQVQDDVSGGTVLEDESPLSTQMPPFNAPLECHPDPESSSGQASEPASAIQDPEQASAARGPAGAVPRSGQYVDDPVNNKSRLQPMINDYHHLELCA